MSNQMWGGEAVTTITEEHRTGRRGVLPEVSPSAYAPNATPLPPLPHHAEYLTAQEDPPRVVARDRAIPLAIMVGVISLTGSLASVLPIDTEWLPAVGVVLAAINAGAVYWYRAVVEGQKDQGRAERV